MEKKPSLSIILPVYNEEAELQKSVQTLISYLESHLTDFTWTVVIADNASTDRTWELAQSLAKKHSSAVRCFHLTQKGRGRAVKEAWKKYPADVLSYMDIDLSTDLKHFGPLVRSILRGYDVAIGSRNAHGARVYGRNALRTLTSKTYILLIKLVFWVHFSDAQCGFKAISRNTNEKVVSRIVDNDWFFDTELLILSEKNGYRIYEEPVTWIDNPGSTVRVMKTAMGDLEGLWRLWWTRPWRGHNGSTRS